MLKYNGSVIIMKFMSSDIYLLLKINSKEINNIVIYSYLSDTTVDIHQSTVGKCDKITHQVQFLLHLCSLLMKLFK